MKKVKICTIPISRFGLVDKIVWKLVKDSKFSVRLALFRNGVLERIGKGNHK